MSVLPVWNGYTVRISCDKGELKYGVFEYPGHFIMVFRPGR